ncbi:54S ribosomal protein L17 mitochondrial [Irineochytrium annulatum]|nr:54S ribosomal protein L17 mitochondrial [Irineochytrium annulatum]
MSIMSAKVGAAILLKRIPVISKDLAPFEAAYLRYRQAKDRRAAATFHHEFYFKKGSLAEQRWLSAQFESEATPTRPSPAWPRDDEIMTALAGVQKREGEDADARTLNRHLQRSLYLLLKNKVGWTLPSTVVKDQEMLHETAARGLTEACGNKMETWFVGKAPIAVVSENQQKVKHVMEAIWTQP